LWMLDTELSGEFTANPTGKQLGAIGVACQQNINVVKKNGIARFFKALPMQIKSVL